MKAEELMIGDLVRVAKDVSFKKGTIVKVRGIDGDNVFPKRNLRGSATCVDINDADRMTNGVWCEYLEPIPLTAELLEQNGFDEYRKNVTGSILRRVYMSMRTLLPTSLSARYTIGAIMQALSQSTSTYCNTPCAHAASTRK